MTIDTTHPLVAVYLDRVRNAAGILPAETRAGLLADVHEHLDAALADVDAGPDDGAVRQSRDDQVRSVLDRLGEPEVLVAAAAEGIEETGAGPAAATQGAARPAAPGPMSRRDASAVWWLVASGPLLIVPPLGVIAWIVGLVRLVQARCWTTTEKILGGLGLAAPFLLLMLIVGLPAAMMWFAFAQYVGAGEDGMSIAFGPELAFVAVLLVVPLAVQAVAAVALLRRGGRSLR